MRIAVSTDELTGVAGELVPELERRGHEVMRFGALAAGERTGWAWAGEAAARAVAAGEADQAVVCCWTGTGASIAANKVRGVRAALCTDAATAEGARKWNDANVLVMSLRLTSADVGREMLDAWFSTAPDPGEAANIARLEAT